MHHAGHGGALIQLTHVHFIFHLRSDKRVEIWQLAVLLIHDGGATGVLDLARRGGVHIAHVHVDVRLLFDLIHHTVRVFWIQTLVSVRVGQDELEVQQFVVVVVRGYGWRRI